MIAAGRGLLLWLGRTWTGAVVLYLALLLPLLLPTLLDPTSWPGAYTESNLRAIWIATALATKGLAAKPMVFEPVRATWQTLADGDLAPYWLVSHLQRGLGEHLGYVLSLAAMLLSAALSVRALCHSQTRSEVGSTLAGALTLLHPGLVGAVMDGDLPLGMLAVPTLAVLFSVRGATLGSLPRLLVGGLLAGVTTWVCWQWAVALLPLLAIALVAMTWRSRTLLGVAIWGALAAIGVAGALELGLATRADEWAPGPPELSGAGTELILRYLGGQGSGYVQNSLAGGSALVLFPTALFAVGLAAGWRAWRGWWLALAAVAVMAAGPGLPAEMGNIPLPMLGLMRAIPALRMIAEPDRWALLAIIPAAVLASAGAGRVALTLGMPGLERAKGVMAGVLGAIAIAALNGQLPGGHFTLDVAPLPGVVAQTPDAAVFVPADNARATLAWRIVHPIIPAVGGPARNWMNRAPKEFNSYAERNTVLRALYGWTPMPAPISGLDIQDLNDRGVSLIVVDRNLVDLEASVYETLLTNLALTFGSPTYQTEDATVFRLYSQGGSP